MKSLQLRTLISRNCKLFFKDKGVFLPSLIAPLILLFLFIAFLGNVYRDSIRSVVQGFPLSNKLVESIAGGWLISSLLAVCAVTIAFTANVIMVQDRATGRRNDLTVAPVPSYILALSYFISTFLVTATICLTALAGGFVYIGVCGWHLSAWEVIATVLDTLLLIFFGTALSSIVCHFLKSQGGVTAVQAIVSSAYGFLCGAYMPFSQLAPWLTDVLMFLPGTYGTGLLHLHLMGGAMQAGGMPPELVTGLMDGFDCNMYFFGAAVPEWVRYVVLAASAVVLAGVYVFLCARSHRRTRTK